MRTSCSQFELMVTFMEEHGDITKPTSEASGRFRHMQNWEQLANLLNGDGSGATKTVERWKKVWSDFKNNTKKKAARLHKAVIETGGGPAAFAKLTDLEQRVLQLVGVQCATGLPAEEAGLSQITEPAAYTPPPLASPLTQLDPQVILSCEPHDTSPHSPESLCNRKSAVIKHFNQSLKKVIEFPVIPWNSNQSGPISSPPHVFEEVPVENPDTLIPARPTTPLAIPRPTLYGQTPRHSSGSSSRFASTSSGKSGKGN